METIATRGLPDSVWSNAPTSSGWPFVQTWKPGAASRLLSRMASSNRSFAG